MKITFYRKGFANNSSSSHSLIFTNKELDNDEEFEFGWQHFTASSKDAKINYLLICLSNQIERVFQRSYEKEFSDGLEQIPIIDKDYENPFHPYKVSEHYVKEWFKHNLPEYYEQYLELKKTTSYVDHQSCLWFPVQRNKSAVNVEFFKDFLSYFVKKNFVVLGGNDNDEYGSPDRGDDLEDAETVFKNIWWNIKDISHEMCPIAVKDEVTTEWIISNKKLGDILKIQLI